VVGGAVGSQRLCGRAQDIKNSCLTYGTPRFIPGHEPLPRPRRRVPFFPRLIIAFTFHTLALHRASLIKPSHRDYAGNELLTHLGPP